MTEAEGRRIVYARSGGLCERCGAARAQSWHHRLPRGQGGTWDPANGLHLCGSGTTGCHGWIESHRRLAHAHGWLVHSWEDPASVPVWIASAFGPGWALLDNLGTLHLVAGVPPQG